MVHCYIGLKVQGLYCMTVSGFSVQVTGLVFVFTSASLVLNLLVTCIRRPLTNTFDESIKILDPSILAVFDGFRSFYIASVRFIGFQVVLYGFRSFYTVLARFRPFLDCFSSFWIVLDRFSWL